jgi:outer membrane biosynthesis protein TonB
MPHTRKAQGISKVAVTISVLLHTIVIVGLFFLAARKGMLGQDLKKIAVTLVSTEKPPEQPKETPPDRPAEPPPKPTPQFEPQRVVAPEIVQKPAPPPQSEPLAVTPPAIAPSPIAPPAAAIPEFDFGGGQLVETSSDAKVLYKSYVEYTLLSNWKRPENVSDLNYVAEMEIAIDLAGRITESTWKTGSGDDLWDKSVRRAVSETKSVGRAPPRGFPAKMLVHFDVREQTETLIP